MNELMKVTDRLIAKGMEQTVALITDGRFSGFNHGTIIGHVAPEAMAGGPHRFCGGRRYHYIQHSRGYLTARGNGGCDRGAKATLEEARAQDQKRCAGPLWSHLPASLRGRSHAELVRPLQYSGFHSCAAPPHTGIFPGNESCIKKGANDEPGIYRQGIAKYAGAFIAWMIGSGFASGQTTAVFHQLWTGKLHCHRP